MQVSFKGQEPAKVTAPVDNQKQGFVQKAKKFVQEHKAPVALAATSAVGLAVVGGLIYSGKLLPEIRLQKDANKFIEQAPNVIKDSKAVFEGADKALNEAEALLSEAAAKSGGENLNKLKFDFLSGAGNKIEVEYNDDKSVMKLKEFVDETLKRQVLNSCRDTRVIEYTENNIANVFVKDNSSTKAFLKVDLDEEKAEKLFGGDVDILNTAKKWFGKYNSSYNLRYIQNDKNKTMSMYFNDEKLKDVIVEKDNIGQAFEFINEGDKAKLCSVETGELGEFGHIKDNDNFKRYEVNDNGKLKKVKSNDQDVEPDFTDDFDEDLPNT